MTKYAMNINDGRRVFNGEAAQKNPNYVDVGDDIVAAINEGKLDWRVVANAVRAKRNNDPNFNWSEFDRLRDSLNVRKADFSLKERSDDGKIQDAAEVEAAKSVNPAISFMEVRKTETRDASAEDNTNVAPVEEAPHGDNFFPIPESGNKGKK